MKQEQLAHTISRFFAPSAWLPILFFMVLLGDGLEKSQIIILLPILFFLQVCVPGFYFYYGLKTKKMSDTDLTKREERYVLFSVIFVSYILSLLPAWYFGTKEFFLLEVGVVLIVAILFLVTFFWKISAHMLGNVAGLCLVNFLFGWKFWPLFIILPFVAWSRFTLKKHTFWQLVLGTLVGFITILPVYLFS